MTADHDSNTSEPVDNYSDEISEPEGMGEGERVAKALARAGVASRREVERYIEDGRVSLNGVVLTTPAVKVAPGDVLKVDGFVVQEAEATRVWRYNKPTGLMTTHNDPKGRATVFENLPASLPRVISIGRLDLNTEGLLLLTNDGELARALELPSTGLMRRYRARARGHITQEKLDKLKDGMTVEGVHYGSIDATLDKSKEGTFGANLWITLSLAEGKNREVRRVLEALGLIVNRLIRLSYGPFSLGELAPGDVEEVGPRVIREQLAAHITDDKMPTGNAVQPLISASRTGQGGVPKSRRDPQRSKADEPKKVYKEGWATPKIKVRPQPKAGAAKRTDRPVTDKVWTPTPPARIAPSRAPSSEQTGRPGPKPWAARSADSPRPSRPGQKPADRHWTTTPPTAAERAGAKKSWAAGPARSERTTDARGPDKGGAPKPAGRPTSERNWTHASTRAKQESSGKSAARAPASAREKFADKPVFEKPRDAAPAQRPRGPVKWAGDKAAEFKRPDRPMYGKPRTATIAPTPRNPTPWAPRKPEDANASERSAADKPRSPKPRTPGKPSGGAGYPRPRGDR